MPVYKDESTNTWFVRTYVKDPVSGKKTQTRKRGFKTKRDAASWENNLLSRNKLSLDMRLEDFVDVYFDDKKNTLKERSIESKKAIINKHILDIWADKKVNEITASDIIWFQNQKAEEGYSESYLRTIDKELRALFTHATKIYGLLPNPCSQVSQMGTYEPNELEFWTKEEYDKFIKTYDSDDRYYVLFEILFWTGIREGELLALTIKDIDINRQTIKINKTYHRSKGKDIITSPKTKQSNRIVDMPEFLAKELDDYIKRLYKYPQDVRIFQVGHAAVQHNMKHHIKMAGVKKIRVHDLRHSHAAYLIHQGVEPLLIKKRLGHKDIKITLNTYGHLYPDDQKKLALMLDENR